MCNEKNGLEVKLAKERAVNISNYPVKKDGSSKYVTAVSGRLKMIRT